ncbi:MAG: DUF4395 domain-containing protein [Streptosporangiales bacterium]|nr:DUF4395 domain-containing protein [Streptosporangiales bacterium]MBO0889918.1 DUF4395 domain-containing protein [Acidothermales bacterium]
MRAPELFSFPNPVNEKAARAVAGGVVVLAVVTLATQWFWLLIPLAYGFLARVLTGPTLSPLGQLATRVVAPRLGAPKPVPGPPKRFAQGMGAAITAAAVVTWFGFGLTVPTVVLLALLVVAATLESVFAICIGCRVFAALMRLGVVPESVCEQCNDIALRQPS